MELLKDLQANMEKTDEFRQSNREAALKDPLSMVADGVGSLGWVTIGVGGGPKPHEYINELFGGAQMYGNKVLKEYRDKYAPRTVLLFNNQLTRAGRKTRASSSGFRHTTNSSKLCPNTQRNTTPAALRGIATVSTPKKPPNRSPPHHHPRTSLPHLLHQQAVSHHRPAHLRHQDRLHHLVLHLQLRKRHQT